MAGRLRVLLSLLVLLGTTLATCPNTNWFLIDSKCYLPLSVPPFSLATQEEARAMCRHIHPKATLPEVFDSDDLMVVQELSQGLGTWLGLYLSTTYDSWRWYSSSSSPSYTHWGVGQPDNAFSCAFMHTDGLWQSASCNATKVNHHVICYVTSGY